VKTCGQCQVNYPDAVEYCPVDGTKLPAGRPQPEEVSAKDALVGTTIDGRYRIESVLGQGGMGYVYAGRHAIIDKRVAIKVLREEHAQNDSSAAQRFLVEAKAASKIGHLNIVDITDFGVLPDGKTYFVMEYLDGPTLGRIMHTGGPLSASRAIGVTVQICRGLAAAHDKGIVHRDLKPENIFILERPGEGQKDFVKIVDFGIAKDVTHKKKLTQAGMVLGTPEYMSPEQATGQPLDHRVDQYALGCILYEMLCGDVPFRAETATKTLTQHVFEKVVPPSERHPELKIPPAIEAVAMRALEKKPNERFANLKEMIEALERVDRTLKPGRTTPSPAVSRAMASPSLDTQAELEAVHGPARRRKAIALGAGLGLLVVVLGVVVASRGGKHHASPAPKAVAQPSLPPETKPQVEPAAQPIAAPPADVEIVLSTLPSGAEVIEGTERLGVAPLHLKRPRSETPIRLVLRRAGYREEAREIVPTADKDIEVVLQAKESKVATRASGVGHVNSRPGTHNPPPAAPKSQAQPTPPKARVSDLRNPFD
jgi:serine/threonine-protein kinase